jgi:hypothetical protein
MCLFLTPFLVAADDTNSEDPTPKVIPERLEFVDDPPLPPALPVPGALPAERRSFGGVTHVQVNVAANGSNIPGDAANEPSLAVDPTNPLLLAIGWRQFDNVGSNFRQGGVGYSVDGGRNWTFPGVLTPGTFRSDPVLSFDKDGNFTYNSLEGDFTTDVFTSNDGGETWGNPVYAHGGDKQWMTTDRTDGIGEGNIYSYWTGNNNFTRSTDEGQSFETPSPIPQSPRWGTMEVDRNGVLYTVGANSSLNGFLVSRSTDAQDPNDPATSFATSSVDLGGSVSYFTGPNPNGLLGQAWIGIDKSNGPNGGNIYIGCTVDPSGSDPVDMHFVRSTDGGQSWSSPLRLNDDTGNNWQWMGTMSVSPDGRLDAGWIDTRNTGQQNMGQLFHTQSTDGGSTWSTNAQISSAWNSHVGWPNQEKIGDYYHMRSDLVGCDLAWANTLNGEQDVYHTRIGDYDCNQNGIGDSEEIAQGAPDSNGNGIIDECEGIVTDVVVVEPEAGVLASSPNPFGQQTTIRFDMPADGGHVRAAVFTPNGQLAKELLNDVMPAGPNELTWDGTDAAGERLPAGVYFFRLSIGGHKDAHRMLLLK